VPLRWRPGSKTAAAPAVAGSSARAAGGPSSARGGGPPSSARGGGPCARSPRGERALMPVRRRPATAAAREGGGCARLRPARRCLVLGPHVGGRLLRPDPRGSAGLGGGGRSWPRAATAAHPSTRAQPAGVASPRGGSMPRGPAPAVETRPKAPCTSLGLARLLRSTAVTAAATRPLAAGYEPSARVRLWCSTTCSGDPIYNPGTSHAGSDA
jgi:hypothetical protein